MKYNRIAVTELEKDTCYMVELIERVAPDNKRNTVEGFVFNSYSEAWGKVNEFIKKYKLADSVKIAVSSPFYGYEETIVKEWNTF